MTLSFATPRAYETQNFYADQLEPRRLLADSTAANVTGTGTLLIAGTSGADVIDIRLDGDDVRVDVNGIEARFIRSAVRRVAVTGASGADFVVNRTNIRSTLDGGEGDDTLIGGSRADTLTGQQGRNVLDGRDGETLVDKSLVLAGEFGLENDSAGDQGFVLGAFRSGQPFVDFVRYRSGISVLLTTGNDTVNGSGSAGIVINAGDGDDSFDGFNRTVTSTGDLAAFDGFATLHGGDGNDLFEFDDNEIPATIVGGDGDDTLFDRVRLADEYGPIDLGAGNDLLAVNDENGGPRTVFMGPGVDKLLTDFNVLQIFGNSLSNTIHINAQPGNSGDQAVSIYGGAGDDVLIAETNRSVAMYGSGGNDLLIGNDGDDTPRGGEGNDTLAGGGGRDRLFGDAGDDLLLGRGGSKDRLDGGAGTDTATADTTPGGVIDLVIDVETVR